MSMIALLDYFILTACDFFLWNFYGEQNLKSINKPIALLLMKLTT